MWVNSWLSNQNAEPFSNMYKLEPVWCPKITIQVWKPLSKSTIQFRLKRDQIWLFICTFWDELNYSRPWILPPNVKRGKTSFHFIESNTSAYLTLTYGPLALCHTLCHAVTATTHTSTHPFVTTIWPSQPKIPLQLWDTYLQVFWLS